MAKKYSARRVAFEVLADVEFDDAYANLIMPKHLVTAGLDSRDSGFAQELAFGTIRWQLFYDEIAEMAAGRPLEEIDSSALIVIRLGAHQLLALRTPPHAAIAETVELAKEVLPAKLTGFVNAVLRRVSERDRDSWMQRVLAGINDENDRLAIRYSHPVWVVRALRQALKLDGREDSLAALLEADNVPAKVSLIALPGSSAASELVLTDGITAGIASPIGFELASGDPGEIAAVREGIARVQDQGSQLVALALTRVSAPKPGERWADFCAGPGGKAALMAAEALLGKAELFCNEVTPHRAKLVKNALEVFDAGLEVHVGDGRELGSSMPEAFDRIMLDAPCTGLGALRRRPEARWRKSPRDLDELTKLQRELFASAVASLKPGGYLAYATCSPHPGETTGQVDWALKQFADIELCDAKPTLNAISPSLELNDQRKTIQLWPHVNGTDAMFLAMFRKKTSGTKQSGKAKK